jgi:ergothioneine biosynthesis protein EgtB
MSIASPSSPPPSSLADPLLAFPMLRAFSESLCRNLQPEDFVPQSMPDTSPTKWHLAHTTWFFETFVLERWERNYQPFCSDFRFLFNSYYNAVGGRHARAERGLLTRPLLSQVFDYRHVVDERVAKLFNEIDGRERGDALAVLELGLHHEQQHQELMLTDVKHLFAQNSLAPAWRAPLPVSPAPSTALGWVSFDAGLRSIGKRVPGFGFDNESPVHDELVPAFALADRLVTNAEYLEFIEDGGYRRPDLWLDAGWGNVQEKGWTEPIYWRRKPDGFEEFTLAGVRELPGNEPVSHVSYLEAAAFATWANARLPRESEWETACGEREIEGNFIDTGRAHPGPAEPGSQLRQLFGDVWEWTQSSYSPYPGYRSAEGALGEYNGKFMCSQLVLRGGSCATSRSHARASYRNFFYPSDRWQFSGIRLARDG